MTEIDKYREIFKKAFTEALKGDGLKAFKKTSLFGSNC